MRHNGSVAESGKKKNSNKKVRKDYLYRSLHLNFLDRSDNLENSFDQRLFM